MLTFSIVYLVRHYLLPHESNNHKPKIFHSSTLAFLILGFLFYQFVIFILPKTGLKVLGYAANIAPGEVIRQINEKRLSQGLNPLNENPTLSQAALAKGADMLNKDYWAHVSPDGVEPWAFFTNVGYSYHYAGENLARDFSNPSAAVEAWMASPSHKENILSAKYKETGVAVIEGDLAGVDTTLIVQFFGTPYVDTSQPLPVAAAVPPPASELQPTIEITVVPTEATAPIAQVTQVPTEVPLSVSSETSQAIGPASKISGIQISPFNMTKSLSLMTVALLLVVLVVDWIIIARKKIVRVGGRNLAHLSFLGMILIIIIIAKAGLIL